jgi:eukaryotic-like serine/threonine-protein kinase
MDYAGAMPRLGEVLADRYRIDAPLGVGGMATVHRARDLRLGRDVAVKVLLPNLAVDGALVERFVREAHALAAVNHPAVVAVYDVDAGDVAAGREPFYVMELCPDGSLADRLRAAGPLSPEAAVLFLVAVADGVAELHRHGLVHRDVKPHNILIAGEHAKIGDFGIVLVESPDDAERTAEGTTLGTLAYLAPERLVGRPATHAADVYGLAASTYEALTGRRPRASGTVAELVERRGEVPPPISRLRPELGPWFDAPVAAGLSAEPLARPEAAAFGRELSGALGRWRDAVARPAGASAPGTLAPGALAGAIPAGSVAAGAIAAGAPSVAAGPAVAGAVAGGPTASAGGIRATPGSPRRLRPPRPVRRDPVTQTGIPVSAPAPAPPAQRAVAATRSPVANGRPVPPAGTPRRGPAPAPARAKRRTAPGDVGMGLIAGVVVMIALILVGAAMLSWIDERSSGAAGASGAPAVAGVAGASRAPAATTTPTPRSTPRPTPTPSPSLTPAPALSPAIASAVDEMRAAIEAATGRHALSTREAATLSTDLASVQSAAASGDRTGAISASGTLTTDVVGLVLARHVTGPAGDRLFESALALGAAVATA